MAGASEKRVEGKSRWDSMITGISLGESPFPLK